MMRSNLDGENCRTTVIYARVSSKDQAQEGFSIPAQQELLRTYAATHSFTVTQEFVDVETAKAAGRTGFGEMMTFLKKNPACHTILVEKTDRLYRNFRDYATIDELGIEVHLVKENIILREDSRSHEKFMHGIKVLMAKNYVDNLSEETRKGMIEKARQGIWPSFAPLGYRNVIGPEGKRAIVPDPNVAPIITRMYERYATGKYSVEEIARIAHADGLAYRKSGAPVPKSSVHKILRNRIYSGDFDFDGTTYTGSYAPIVSRELWQQVQGVLDGRNARKTRRVKHDFAFGGLLTCGHCGCALVGDIKKGRYVYYRCTHFKRNCPEPYTREEVLEQKFTDMLNGIHFSPDVLAWAADAMREGHVDERKAHADAILRLQREHQRVQDRIDRMYDDKLDRRIDNEFFDRKAAEFRAEQSRIMADIAVHQAAMGGYVDEGARLGDLAHRAGALFEVQPAAEKRKLLDYVVSECRWKGGELETVFREPFGMMVSAAAMQQVARKPVQRDVASNANCASGGLPTTAA
jgi:DNA invertase Pin-like site-specific DNA recombinase